MRSAIIIAAALALSACAMAPERKFYKDGATQETWARDSYGCERDTRMAVPQGVYTQSVYANIDAQGFFIRCMSVAGWVYR